MTGPKSNRTSSLAHVLLIEDDPKQAHAIGQGITQQNAAARLHAVGEGESVITALERGQPVGEPEVDFSDLSLVILDLHLPGVDGHEVLQRLKTHEQAAMIPVIVLTRSRDEADRSRAYDAHANGYLVKPENPAELADLVREAQRYWSAWNWPPA